MTGSALEQMYQQLILEHAKRPHGRGLVDAGGHAHGESHQVNPTCGDEVRLRVSLGGSAEHPVVETVSWEGQGCSISTASTSVLTELVTGAGLDEVERVAGTFREMMGAQGRALDEEAEDLLGDAAAFAGVARYPARVKCALLGWMALRDALILARGSDAGVAAPAAAPAVTED